MARHAFVAAFLCAALVVAPAWAQTAGEPGGGEVGNATDLAAEFACKEPPPWGFALGVAMGTVASVGINIGQNMQADGIRKLPEEQRDKEQWRSPLWRYGMGVFHHLLDRQLCGARARAGVGAGAARVDQANREGFGGLGKGWQTEAHGERRQVVG